MLDVRCYHRTSNMMWKGTRPGKTNAARIDPGPAILAGMQGDYERAAEMFEQALSMRRQMGDPSALLSPLNNLAIARQRLGDWLAAEALYREVSEISQAAGNHKALGHALYGMGQVNMAQDKHITALALYRQSLEVRRQLGDRPAISLCLGAIGQAFLLSGDARRAAALVAAGEALQSELGMVASPGVQAERGKTITEIRSSLGEPAFSLAWEEGLTKTLEEMIEEALNPDIE